METSVSIKPDEGFAETYLLCRALKKCVPMVIFFFFPLAKGEGRRIKSTAHCLPRKPQVTAEPHISNPEFLEGKLIFLC